MRDFFYFDGYTLFLLVVLVPFFLFLPGPLLEMILGVPDVSIINPAWLSILTRILIAVGLAFWWRRLAYPNDHVRVNVVMIALAVSAVILAVLQVAGVIDLF